MSSADRLSSSFGARAWRCRALRPAQGRGITALPSAGFLLQGRFSTADSDRGPARPGRLLGYRPSSPNLTADLTVAAFLPLCKAASRKSRKVSPPRRNFFPAAPAIPLHCRQAPKITSDGLWNRGSARSPSPQPCKRRAPTPCLTPPPRELATFPRYPCSSPATSAPIPHPSGSASPCAALPHSAHSPASGAARGGLDDSPSRAHTFPVRPPATARTLGPPPPPPPHRPGRGHAAASAHARRGDVITSL